MAALPEFPLVHKDPVTPYKREVDALFDAGRGREFKLFLQREIANPVNQINRDNYLKLKMAGRSGDDTTGKLFKELVTKLIRTVVKEALATMPNLLKKLFEALDEIPLDNDKAVAMANFIQRQAEADPANFNITHLEQGMIELKGQDQGTFDLLNRVLRNIVAQNAGQNLDGLDEAFLNRLNTIDDRRERKGAILITKEEEKSYTSWQKFLAEKFDDRASSVEYRMNTANGNRVYENIELALMNKEEEVRVILSIPEGVQIKDYINEQLRKINPTADIDGLLAEYHTNYQAANPNAPAPQSFTDLQALSRRVSDSQRAAPENIQMLGERQWYGYHSIAELMGDYYINRDLLYEKLLLPPDANGHREINTAALQDLRDQTRQVVNNLLKALHASPTEGGELYQELHEGSVLRQIVSMFMDASSTTSIKSYLDKEQIRDPGEREKLTTQFNKIHTSIATAMLANKDLQFFGTQINLFLQQGDLERMAGTLVRFPIGKFKDIFVQSPYAQMAPHLWEQFLDRKIADNNNIVPTDLFVTSLTRTDKDGNLLRDKSMYTLNYKTRDEFMAFFKEHCQSIGLNPRDSDIQEAFIVGQAFNAMTFRTPSQFTRTIPRQDFDEIIYPVIVGAIDGRFTYGEELGTRSIQKGDDLRIDRALSAPMMHQETGFIQLLTNPHNPQALANKGELRRNKINYMVPIELRHHVHREHLYHDDNLTDLTTMMRQASMGDFLQSGWRARMFREKFRQDMEDRRRFLTNTHSTDTVSEKWSYDNESLQKWFRTRGGILVEFIHAEDFAGDEATAYLDGMAQREPELLREGLEHAEEENAEVRKAREEHGFEFGTKNTLKPFMGAGELAKKETMEIMEVGEHGEVYKRNITYNEFKFRLGNANRGRAWYHEAILNPSQFLLNLEHLMINVAEGSIKLKEPASDGRTVMSAREFYLGENVDRPDRNGITISEEDKKRRRSFRSELLDVFEGEDSIHEIGYLMDFYNKAYTALESQNVPAEDRRKQAREVMYKGLARAFGRARYMNKKEESPDFTRSDDPDRDGKLYLTRKHFITEEEDNRMLVLSRMPYRTTEEEKELQDLNNMKKLSDLFLSTEPGSEGLIAHYMRTVGGAGANLDAILDGDVRDREGNIIRAPQLDLTGEEIYFGKRNRNAHGQYVAGNDFHGENSRYLGDNLSFFHRIGFAHSEKKGLMSAPTFDYDTVAVAEFGDTSSEKGLARHAFNYKPMVEARQAITKLYKATKSASHLYGDPFKEVFAALDKIKTVFKDTKEEAIGKELNAQVLQIAIGYLLKDDRNRFPGWSGDIMTLMLGEWSSLSRHSQGPGSMEINRDDLFKILKQAHHDSLITHEAYHRILEKFNSLEGFFWLSEGIPNALAAFTLLALAVSIQEAFKELEGGDKH